MLFLDYYLVELMEVLIRFNMGKNDIEVESKILTRFDDVQGIDSAKDELEELSLIHI